MKLTIVAATGGIGRQLLEQASKAGHQVTAVVRRPDRLAVPVRAVAIDLADADPALLEDAVAGADAVLSGLGPRNRGEDGIVSTGTRAVITAMRTADVRRLVAVSVAGIAMAPDGRSGPDPGTGWFIRAVLGRLATARLHDHYADISVMHQLLDRSGLDWTTVGCPLLTNQPATGRYRTATEQSVPGGWRIGRADAAAYMLHTVTEPATIRHHFAIAY